MNKLSFSGHDTFHCRHFWLKKGYDYVCGGKKFTDEQAIIELGVGRNMVNSIKFWLKSFQLIDASNQPTSLAHAIFNDRGYDPFLEDIGTLWLLHYHLVSSVDIASIYSLVFNDFRKLRPEYTYGVLLNYLHTKAREYGQSFSENTLSRDITVFRRTYVRPEKGSKSLEDDFAAVLLPLNLIQPRTNHAGDMIYRFSTDEKESLPPEILLYTILVMQSDSLSVSFDDLLSDWNSPGNVFLLTADDLYRKLSHLAMHYPFITFLDDAGIKELQFKDDVPKPSQLLYDYYKM